MANLDLLEFVLRPASPGSLFIGDYDEGYMANQEGGKAVELVIGELFARQYVERGASLAR